MSAAPSAGARAPSGEVEVVKLNQMRKTIARRMTEAWEAPAFQISTRHHHVPGGYGIKIANKEKRPKKRYNECDCQNRVLNEEAPFTLR